MTALKKRYVIYEWPLRQQIEYGIYVVEQKQADFNKGLTFNVGFTEALKMKDWDCFIFHDIDTIPIDDRNIYNCPSLGVRHMTVAIDKFKYKWDRANGPFFFLFLVFRI